MDGSWGDYCGGSSYTLEYVAGSKAGFGPNYINTIYTSKTKYNTAGLSNPNPYFEGAISDLTWEGTHTLRIVAQQGTGSKLYRKITGPDFTVTYSNKCLETLLTPGTLTDLKFTLGDTFTAYKTYTDFQDSISVQFGNGYDKCGPRIHYLTDSSGGNRVSLNI